MKKAIQKKLDKVPRSPGVYVFRDSKGAVIYVGKAINLRNRLRSYFNAVNDFKTARLVQEIASFEVIPIASEGEALVLEASLIKKHQPQFNVEMKDGKSFPYVKLTKEKFPSLQIVREKMKPDAEYFGPFTDVGCLRKVLRFIRTFFPVRTCRGNIASQRKRSCTAYFLRRCPAPCTGRISSVEYKKSLQGLKSFLSGNYRRYRELIRQDMERAIQRWDFEHAKILSERMNLLERMERRIPWRKEEELLSYRRANVLPNLARALGMDKIPAVIEGYDVSNLGGAFATGSRVVFKGGVPFKQGYRKFRIRTVEGMDDYRMMRELLRRRFSNPRHGEHPDLILIDGGLGHLHEALSELNDMKISIPVIALAKEHERVFVANRKGVADIQPNSPELLLLMHIRDEAHRFARGYHMKLRSKISHLSAFSHMPGIGPVRRKILVDIFADTQLKGFPEGKLRAAKIPVPIIEKLKESFENKHM